MIPKIFHRVWIGDKPMPEAYELHWQKWKLLHQNWEFVEWNSQNISTLDLYPMIQKIQSNAAKADVARYEILYRYGGIYIDADMDCVQPIDEILCEEDDFIVCNQIDDFRCLCSIGFIASIPNHQILENAIRELKCTEIKLINDGNIAEITGPYFFRRVINNRKVKLLRKHAFYPYLHLRYEYFTHPRREVYGIHRWGGSWLPIETSIYLAEKQYKHRDLESCIETCSKAISWNADLSTETHSTSINYLRKLLRKCEKEIVLKQKIAFLVLHYLVKMIFRLYELSINIRKLSLLYKKLCSLGLLCSRFMTKFSLGRLSFYLSKIQYEHVLDTLFNDRTVSSEIVVLEIGAMDGKSFDRLYPYIRTSSNVTAVFIEPIPHFLEELTVNYRGWELQHNRFYFENVAIAENEGESYITTIPPASIEKFNLPNWVRGISSLVPEKNILSSEEEFVSKQEKKKLLHLSVRQVVNTTPLKRISEKYNLTNVDIIQIDTEGYDLVILKQCLELFTPKLICFEWVNLDLAEKHKAIQLLNKKGFFFCHTEDYQDCFAIHSSYLRIFIAKIFSKYSLILIPFLP